MTERDPLESSSLDALRSTLANSGDPKVRRMRERLDALLTKVVGADPNRAETMSRRAEHELVAMGQTVLDQSVVALETYRAALRGKSRRGSSSLNGVDADVLSTELGAVSQASREVQVACRSGRIHPEMPQVVRLKAIADKE